MGSSIFTVEARSRLTNEDQLGLPRPRLDRSKDKLAIKKENARRVAVTCPLWLEQTADLDSMALFVARLLCSRFEVELTFTLLIKDAIGSRTATTHVHPVAGMTMTEPGPKSLAEAASTPVYQTPLIITFLISLL